jgi:hypothetical protein
VNWRIRPAAQSGAYFLSLELLVSPAFWRMPNFQIALDDRRFKPK